MRERPEKDQRRGGQQPSSTGGFKLQIDERDRATGNIDLPQRRRSQPTPYAPTANDQGYLTEKERKAEKKAHKKRDKLKARKNRRIFSLVWLCMVLLVFFLVGERKDAELTLVLSIPMNQPQARTWTIVSGAEALAAFAGEFQEMTG